MTDAEGPSGLVLDDVVARVRELPSRVRSLRVATHGWTDIGLSRLASDRARGLLARHLPRAPDAVALIARQSVVSWMVFNEDSWNRPMFDVVPTRWREEHESTSPVGGVTRSVQGHDEDTHWWDQGDGVKATDGRNSQASLAGAWVVGTRWTTAPAESELLGAGTVIGRSGVRVRMVPQAGLKWGAAPFFGSDAHELVVDLVTGMTLSVTNLVDGSPFQHREVVDFELNADIPREFTAAPGGAEAIPVSQGFRSPEDVANAAQFPLLTFR